MHQCVRKQSFIPFTPQSFAKTCTFIYNSYNTHYAFYLFTVTGNELHPLCSWLCHNILKKAASISFLFPWPQSMTFTLYMTSSVRTCWAERTVRRYQSWGGSEQREVKICNTSGSSCRDERSAQCCRFASRDNIWMGENTSLLERIAPLMVLAVFLKISAVINHAVLMINA